MFRQIVSVVTCVAATIFSFLSTQSAHAAPITATITGTGSGQLKTSGPVPFTSFTQKAFEVTLIGDTSSVELEILPPIGPWPAMNVQIMPALEATLRLNNGTPYEISNPTQAFYNEHFGIVGFSKLTPGGVNDFLNVEAGSALVGFSFNSNVLVTDPTPPEWTLDFFDLQFSNGGRIIMDDFTGSMTFRTTGVSPEPSSALFGIMCVLFTRRSKR